MKTLILAVIVAGIVEGFVETVREHRRIAHVIAETNAALVERADEINARRERMIEREFAA
jgi:hypothetical protein